MRAISTAATAFLMFSVAPCGAADRTFQGIGEPDLRNLPALVEILRFNSKNLFLVGPLVPCAGGSTCPVDATVTETYDLSGQPLGCTVKAGDVQITYAVTPPSGALRNTKLVFSLQVPATAKATYEFLDPGILMVRDYLATLDPTTDVTATRIMATHRYKFRRYEALYFPLVLQTGGIGGPWLCGAGDPKMINN